MIEGPGTLSRRARGARALVAASFATGIALGFHVLGGGDAPSAAGIAVPLVLSMVVCWQLATRMGSWWRTAVGVTVSQGLFHTLFVIGTPGTVTSTAGHAHHMAPGDLVVESASAGAHLGHGGTSMALSHVGAAVITTAMLVRLDWALVRADEAMRALVRSIAILAQPVAAPVAHRSWARQAPRASALRPSPVSSGHGLRGPPVSVSSLAG